MNEFDWQQTKQLSIPQILAAVFIPSAGGYAFFHFISPTFVKNGMPVLMAWALVASIGLAIIVLLAIYLLRKDARSLGISFAERACLKSVTGKRWLIYVGILIAMFILMGVAQQISIFVVNNHDIQGLAHMPFFMNPTLNPMTTDMAILSPGLPLKGAYFVIPLMTVTIALNILAEELYFRAWLMPKMLRFGGWTWVLNGSLFALYHTFQIWLLPVILVASLTFAFIVYHSRSIYPALVFHFIANLLLGVGSVSFLIFSN